MNATTARGNMHHSLIRGERIEVHFDSKIPPHLRPRFDDDASANGASPISPGAPPHMARSGSDEGRQYANDGYKSHPPTDKPDFVADKKPNARFGQRSVPRGYRADEGNGSYQGERRWNGPPGAHADRRPPGGPTRARPYSSNHGPPRPYDRNNGTPYARGGYRERGFRGRMHQGGDSKGHGGHVNIRGSYIEYEASNGHGEYSDRRTPPPSQHVAGRNGNDYAERTREGGDDWQSGDDDRRVDQSRHYSTSPSQRQTRSISPGHNDDAMDHQGEEWAQSPHPEDIKFTAPSLASPRGAKQGSASGSYYDEEFSIAPEVQPRTYSP
ncbi:hypothetical protein GGI21_001901 [Coemansia aciculifera]|nr:hypothetical protein GGI21_001901 [Coemansia aciculifera]